MLSLLFLLAPAAIAGDVAVPGPNPCEDLAGIAAEFMELELAGARWQGGDSACLPKVRARLLKGGASPGPADPALLDPDFLLPRKRNPEIRTRRLPRDLLEVKFTYLGKKVAGDGKGKELRVDDELLLKLQFGASREEKGCAILHRGPRHLVMREGCSED